MLNRISTENLKKAYTKHLHFLAQDCEDWEDMRMVLENMDLSKYEISGLNFSKAIFKNCDFSNSNLKSCVFSGCDLSGSTFRGADMHNCNFEGCYMHYASFINAKLFKANFGAAIMKNVNFRGCDLEKSSWFETKIVNTLFEQCELIGAEFIRTDFHHVVTFMDSLMKNIVMDQILGLEDVVIDGVTFNEEDGPQTGIKSLRYICPRDYARYAWNKFIGNIAERVNQIGRHNSGNRIEDRESLTLAADELPDRRRPSGDDAAGA